MSINVQRNIKTLKGSVQIVAQAMAASSGIKVKFGNNATAFIASDPNSSVGREIHLPNLPANDDEAKILTWGYLTHEIAHDNFTNFSTNKSKHPAKLQAYQILEDVRIEILSSNRYPGSAINLKRLIAKLVEENKFLPIESATEVTHYLLGYMSTTLRADLLNQATKDLARQYELVLTQGISKGVFVKFNALMYEISSCKSTGDVVLLVEKIFDMFKDEQEQEPPPENDDQDQNQDDSDQNSNSKPKTDENDSGDDTNSSSAAGGSEDGEQSNSSSKSSSKGASDAENQALQQILNGSASCGNYDLGDMVASELNQMQSENQYESLSPMSKQTLPVGVDSTMLSNIRMASNATKRKIMSLLEARARSHTVHKSSGSHLNHNRITRVLSGDLSVFDKKVIGKKQNTAIQILIDISGSMSGGNDKLAVEAGLSVALALEQTKGIKCAVSAFPFNNSILELTGFQERTSGTSKRYIKATANGGTPMSEAILTVSYDLLNQDTDRKLMLVITDGLPNNAVSCEQVISSVIDMDVEFLGLGINSQIPDFFNVRGFIDNINQLPSTMFNMLKQQLLN